MENFCFQIYATHLAKCKHFINSIVNWINLGSSCLVLPLPYKGTTFSLLMAALQTGHTCRFGRVSNH